MTREVSTQDFDASVLKASKPVIVDFYADWCGPCRMQAPVLETWAITNQDKADVVKMDVDKSPEIASRYGVMSVPTLVIFNSGNEAGRAVGFQSEKALDGLLAKAKP